jgi:hypothetical protein
MASTSAIKEMMNSVVNPDRRLYGQLNLPYYCWTPPYRQDSGGVRAMHLLCHALNLLGEEAYVTTTEVHPALRTPMVSQEILTSHVQGGRQPIVVYPEVVHDNPLGAVNVVRYLLAEPALHTGVPIVLQERDLVYTFGPTLVPEGWHADPLRMPLVDTQIFHDDGVVPGSRVGSAVFISRYLQKGGELSPVTSESIEISARYPRGAAELAEVLRSVEVLYMYEYSTITFEALMCGCPVVFLPNAVMLDKSETWLFDGNGIAWGADPRQIAHAKATVPAAQEFYAEEERQFWRDLRAFVAKTQARGVRVFEGQG